MVVEYFSDEHLFACLDTLADQTHKPEKVVVVLNGIESKYRQHLEDDYPDVHVIDPHANLGYSRAANLGIANTTSPIVATLNPDIDLDAKCAEMLCAHLRDHEDVACAGPAIFEINGELYPSARSEPRLSDAIGHGLLGAFMPNNKFSRRYKNLDANNDVIRTVDWLSGAAVFIRRSSLDEVGGWDEDFFMYCEDIDLGRRFKKSGWVSAYIPEAKLVHVQGVSTSRTPISLLYRHHVSLYTYASKKYSHQPIMKALTGLFIVVRFPLALIAHVFRIN